MIAKIVKGASFRGCVQYVTGKDEAKILASDGVLLGSVGNIGVTCITTCINQRS